MTEFIAKLFDTSDFVPRASCGDWSPGHVWLHNASDASIWASYMAIPCVLVFFASRKGDVPFRPLFWLFGAFIVTCGLTHLMDVVMFYHPVYRLAGLVKFVTAVASVATVAALVPAVPAALAMRTPAELQREINRRVQAEAALQAANADLERRVAELAEARADLLRQTRLAALGQVAASVAHDLRNPLGAVRNAAYFLRRKVPADQPVAVEQLRLIDRETATCDRIINNLLEMSRGREPVREPVDVAAAARESLERASPPAGVSWEVEAGDGPAVAWADPVQLRQVFDNLARNALDALDGRGGRVRVGVRLDGPEVVADFRDDGPGVPPEHRAKLFEPLYTTKARGTGLGLFICRQVAERHGGSLELVEPAAGEPGAHFRLRLPRPDPGGDVR